MQDDEFYVWKHCHLPTGNIEAHPARTGLSRNLQGPPRAWHDASVPPTR